MMMIVVAFTTRMRIKEEEKEDDIDLSTIMIMMQMCVSTMESSTTRTSPGMLAATYDARARRPRRDTTAVTTCE